MPTPLFPTATSTLAAAAPGAAGFLVWILLTAGGTLIAVVRVLRLPACDWPHGIWSKVGWVLVVLYVVVPIGGYPIPLGAIAALWTTRRSLSSRQARLPYGETGEAR